MNEQKPWLSSILLPDELIVQILLRLPVSSLVRFKCVSKLWFSVISDPQFVKSHFDLAASPTHRLLLNCTRELRFQSLDVDSLPPNNDSAVLNYLSQNHDGVYGFEIDSSSNTKLQVLGSCRGFLLLLSPNQFIVCNPSTGFHRKIPSSTTSFGYAASSQYGITIGYDQSTDDYLLVSINSYGPDPTINLFSLKTNLPSLLTLDHDYRYIYYDNQNDLFLHGSLHWVVRSCLMRPCALVAFDLVGKSLSEIALSPDLAWQLDKKPYDLREMAGCLGLCYTAYGGMIEIWIMKEYKVQSSWTKIVFSTHDIHTTPGFFPICFTKCGDIFGSDEAGRFLRVNNKGKLLAVWPWESKYCILYSRMYTPSLLSLPS